MKSKSTRIFFLFFLLLSRLLLAQVSDDLRFEKLPSEIEFYNTGVNDILEDHQGFLWLATWSGLAKYDGYSMKMYRQMPGNSNGLMSNKITQIYEDSKNRMWVGTNYSGFYLYNRELDVFEQFCKNPEDQNSLIDDNVLALCEDKDAMLWIGTERGLNRFDPETSHFLRYENDPRDSRSLSHNFVYSITETADGSLWIGTEEGLNRMVRKNGRSYFVHYDLRPSSAAKQDSLTHNFVYKIIPSRYDEEQIWLCTSNGLKKAHFSANDPSSFEFEFFGHIHENPNSLNHPFIPDVLEENESQIWVATYYGLDLLDLKTKQVKHFIPQKDDPDCLSSNIVMCLTKDRTGNLWIGLDKGMNKLNLRAKPFQNVVLNIGKWNTSNNVMCILPASDQKGMWVGTRGGGLNFLPTDNNGNLLGSTRSYVFETEKFPNQINFIFNLLVDNEGWLWLATDGAGVVRIREQDFQPESASISDFQQFIRAGRISGDYVVSILESVSNDIWIGYWDKGLDRYDKASDEFSQYVFTTDRSINLQEFPIVHLLEVIENGVTYLLIGSRGGGVYKLKYNAEKDGLDFVQHFRSGEGQEGNLSNDFVNCLMLDSQNRLWVGTDNGLNVLDNKAEKFKSFYERDGLKNSIIQSVLEDQEGNIWVSTQQGISSLHLYRGKTEVKNFDAYDGLQDNFFNDDAAAITEAGHLVFGGVNGLSIFKPEKIKIDTIAPKIAITDLRLFNRSVPIGRMENGRTVLSKNISEVDHIELTHHDNVLTFQFTGLHFNEPKKLSYAHQLEGVDPDWVFTNADQRIAHYTNLPYDDFTFKVKAANGDGVWSKPVELQLTVKPPFWLTGWAYALYALVLAILIYLGYRMVKLRAEFRHSLELERVEREKLEEVNKMKLQFFTNISHELRTPLTLIISPLEQLVQNKGQKKLHQLYTRMHYNANRLLTMINQLLDIRKSEAGLMNLHVSEGDIVEFGQEITSSFGNLANQRNIQLRFSSQLETIMAWFDHDQMEKVLFNLLSNAFKFTKDGGSIEVRISQSEQVVISVSDTGVGIPAGQLENVFQRFYQVEKGQEWARKSGTGIGLSLAKMIVEKHHGKIKVESEEGQGTTFSLYLKKGKAHFTESELSPAEKALPDWPMAAPHSAPVSKEALPTKNTETKPLVLIVEDNPDIRSYLRDNLEQAYRISEAADGQEGLEKTLSNTPDLIIADIAMPRMDGIEMCRKVKSNVETSHVPVILLTARTSLVFQVDGLETGADDYVTKPFHMRLLATRIKNLISSRQSLRERFSKTYDLSPSGIVLNSLDEQLLSQIKTVVERHIDDSDFSVDQLAKSLNMSRAKQYRKIKALTGKSPNEIIIGFRLKRAVQLLESKQYNISDVAYMVGYNDVKSFREQFKKEYGVTPSGYTVGS